jgi:hypothetical protein
MTPRAPAVGGRLRAALMAFLLLALMLWLTVGAQASDYTPTKTAVPTDTPTTHTPVPTDTPTTHTPVPTDTPTTHTPVPTHSPTNTPVPTHSPTNTPVPTKTPTPGQEGCTPGFWKTHPEAWNIGTGTTLEQVFDVPDTLGLDDVTLQDALGFQGGTGFAGGARILLRAASAAYLNAVEPNVDYPLSPDDVVDQVNAALATGDRAAVLDLAEQLDAFNNLDCPDAKTLT